MLNKSKETLLLVLGCVLESFKVATVIGLAGVVAVIATSTFIPWVNYIVLNVASFKSVIAVAAVSFLGMLFVTLKAALKENHNGTTSNSCDSGSAA